MGATLRVLHLFPFYLSATENWIFRLLDNLPDVDVAVASKHFLLTNFYPSRFEYFEFPLKKLMNPEKKFWLRLVNGLISVILKPYPLYVQKNCGKCDLIHSHFSVAGWEYRSLPKRLGIPHVVSFYGYDYEYLPFHKPVWKKQYHRLFQEAELFLCEGSNGSQILQKNGCPREKIRISRLGVDLDNISFWYREKKPGELNLLQVASFVEKKGHRYSIEAFNKALPDCPNMTLTFVGSDPRNNLKTKLKQQVENSHAKGKVFFLGPIDIGSLYTLMKAYHVFIHPSCYSDERDCEGGAPIVLLDAQATGMPVISTTHCDIPDEVIHEKTGLLTPEKDVLALTKSIQLFYKMGQQEYDRYSQNAREHVKREYDVKLTSRKVRNIYDDLLTSAST